VKTFHVNISKAKRLAPTPFLLSMFALLLLCFVSSLVASDECASNTASINLSNTNTSYVNSNNATNQNGDKYYIVVDRPGTLDISVTTSNSHLLTTSMTSCPANENGTATKSLTIDTSDLDLNLMV